MDIINFFSKIIASIILTLIYFTTHAQNNHMQLEWQKCLGGSVAMFGGVDQSSGIIQTKDGGYIVTTSNQSDSTATNPCGKYYRIMNTKISKTGAVIWQNCDGLIGFLPESSVATKDGGFAIVGVGSKTGTSDFYIGKFDSLGMRQWEKCYGGSSDDVGKAIIQTNDGNLIAVGYSNSNDGDVWGVTGNSWINEQYYFGWIMKLNIHTGDTIFSKMPRSGYCVGVQELADSTLVTTGSNSGNGNFLRYDKNGNAITFNTYGFNDSMDGYASLCSSHRGGWLLSGGSGGNTSSGSINYCAGYHSAPLNMNGMISEINASGTEMWHNCYGTGTINYTRKILPDPRNNGQYYVIGMQYVEGNAWVAGWLFKIDANNNGTMLWREDYGDGFYTEFKNAIVDDEGSLIVVGQTTNTTLPGFLGNSGSDGWVLKLTDPDVVGIKDLTQQPLTINPLSENKYQITITKPTQITLTDIQGKIIKQINAENNVEIDLNNYAQGVYLLSATGYKTTKLVR